MSEMEAALRRLGLVPSEFSETSRRHLAWMEKQTYEGRAIIGRPLEHFLEAMDKRKWECGRDCPFVPWV